MLRIGICDDNQDARMALCAELEGLLDARGAEYRCFEFSSGGGLLAWLEKHPGELDLVFLDIEMPGVDGMETARRLRQRDEGLQLVFVTGYSDYVYDGYSVGALGYLLKPPKRHQLDGILSRARSALGRDAVLSFLCCSGETSYRVLRKDILYFRSDKRQISCVTAAKTYTFYGKLDDVEAQLQDESFVRIHQSYLVHAPAVERIDGGELSAGGATLPISRACRSSALLALTREMLK